MHLHLGQEFASAAFGAQPDFGGVILGIQSQLSLAGIDPSGFSQIDNHFHLVEAASFGEQAAGELQPSQRRLSWLRDGQRRIAHVFPGQVRG